MHSDTLSITMKLSSMHDDEFIIDKAMDEILNNRTIKKTYQIKKVKK